MLNFFKPLNMKQLLFFVLAGTCLCSFNQVKDVSKAKMVIADSINEPLQEEIQKMCDFDQGLRSDWSKLKKQFGADSRQVDSVKREIAKYRAIHSTRLKGIYKKYGFPTHKIIGKDGVENILVLAAHSLDTEFQNLTFVYLMIEAKDGAIEWQDLAILMDKIRMNEGKPQYFATQTTNSDITKKEEFELYKIADEKNLDQRRTAIGMLPIKDHLKKFGIEYKQTTDFEK